MTPAARSRPRSSCSTRSSPPRARRRRRGRHARSRAISRPAAMPARRTAARCASSSSARSAAPASGRRPGAPPCSAWRGRSGAARCSTARRTGPRRSAPDEPVAEAGDRAGLAARAASIRWSAPDELAGPARARAARRAGQPAARARATRRCRLPDAEPTPHVADRPAPAGRHQVEQIDAWRRAWSRSRTRAASSSASPARAAPGMLVVDLCAGAGGKTLALAAEMANEGRIVACDTDRGRLSRLPPRLARAGVTIVETAPARSGPRGRGARRPRRAGRSRPGRRALLGHRHLAAQSGDALAAHARPARPADRAPGASARSRREPAQARAAARLCGLLAARRGGQGPGGGADRPFIAGSGAARLCRRGVPPGAGLLLSPARDGTDGFFVARWRRAMLSRAATGIWSI